jgi:hypothetical protein
MISQVKIFNVLICLLLIFQIVVSHQGVCLGNLELKYTENPVTKNALLSLKSREKNGYHFVTLANNLSNPLQGKYISITGYLNNSVLDYYLQVGNQKDVNPVNFVSVRAHLFFYYDVIQQNFNFPISLFNISEFSNQSFFIQVGSSPRKPKWMNGQIVFPETSEVYFQRGASEFDYCYRPLKNVELFHPASFSGFI